MIGATIPPTPFLCAANRPRRSPTSGGSTMSTAELVSASATELAQAIRFLKTIQPMAKSAAELLGLWFRWDQWRSAMLGWMQSYDLVLCPVSATPALPHG